MPDTTEEILPVDPALEATKKLLKDEENLKTEMAKIGGTKEEILKALGVNPEAEKELVIANGTIGSLREINGNLLQDLAAKAGLEDQLKAAKNAPPREPTADDILAFAVKNPDKAPLRKPTNKEIEEYLDENPKIVVSYIERNPKLFPPRVPTTEEITAHIAAHPELLPKKEEGWTLFG